MIHKTFFYIFSHLKFSLDNISITSKFYFTFVNDPTPREFLFNVVQQQYIIVLGNWFHAFPEGINATWTQASTTLIRTQPIPFISADNHFAPPLHSFILTPHVSFNLCWQDAFYISEVYKINALTLALINYSLLMS